MIHQEPQELLSRIEKVDGGNSTQPLHATVLVTTSLAKWLDEDNPFLLELAMRLCFDSHGVRKLSQLDFTVAVVDKLPGPSDREQPLGQYVPSSRVSTAIHGVYEGVSIRLTTQSSFYPRIEPLTSRNKSGTRRFTFTQQSPMERVNMYIQIDLQLAKTMFVNGSDAMMFSVQAKIPKSSDEGFSFSSRQELHSLTISTHTSKWHLNLPLEPLTQPRRIASTMGNIINSIEAVDGNGEEHMPASTELEQAVSKFLSQHGITTTQVFAYIRESQAGIEAVGRENETHKSWPDLLLQGTLRKVTGGGGGWGEKRGLLSVDPSTSLNEVSEDNQLTFDSDGNALIPDSAIARPGDTVQFLGTLPDPLQGTPARYRALPNDKDFGLSRNNLTILTTVGKIPPSIDGGDGKVGSKQERWTTVPNLFGMLSEENIAIRTKMWSSLPNAEQTGQLKKGYSRLNVPYASFSLIEFFGPLRDDHPQKVKIPKFFILRRHFNKAE